MNEWSGVFLGIIALAVSVMAIVQVGVVVFGARLAAELAALQVERVDALFADVAGRVEETAASLQSAIIAPAREGMALVQGIKAAFAALREIRGASAPAGAAVHDEDDPLFIG